MSRKRRKNKNKNKKDVVIFNGDTSTKSKKKLKKMFGGLSQTEMTTLCNRIKLREPNSTVIETHANLYSKKW